MSDHNVRTLRGINRSNITANTMIVHQALADGLRDVEELRRLLGEAIDALHRCRAALRNAFNTAGDIQAAIGAECRLLDGQK